jgi:hypothetical protein
MTATLTVLSGALAGTRLDIDDSADEILVGSDPDCGLALDVSGVSPIHARLWLDNAGLIVFDTHSPRGLYVNDARVDGQAALRDGDVLWLGTPGDESSVMIQCRVEGGATAGAPQDSPLAGLEDLLAAPPEAPVASVVATSAAAAPEPSDDVFFMDEPKAPAASAAPDQPAPAVVEPVSAPEDAVFFEEEAPPAVVTPPPRAAPAAAPDFGLAEGEDLFFVEEPAAAPPAPEPPPLPAHVATPAAAPPLPAPPRAAAPPSVPASAAHVTSPAAAPPRPAPAVIGSAAASPPAAPPRAPRRAGPTPPPSAMPEVEAASAPPRARSAPSRAPTAAGRRGSPPLGMIAAGVGLLLVLTAAGVVVLRSMRTPAIDSIAPSRVGLGQSVVITGSHFAPQASGNVVHFGGKPGRVVQASDTRLQVEIPEMAAAPGRDTPVPVVVVVDGRGSKPASVGVFLAPRVHGIAPTVAMPGDEVLLAGAGWGAGARVQFGGIAATVLDSSPTSLRVRVPALEGGPGKEFPVTVAMGADTSNPAPFLIGHLPLVISIAPPAAAPGDVVTVVGRGFAAKASGNDVRVGGARALVTSATGSEIKAVVPRTAPGEAVLEVRVPGLENVGQASLSVGGTPDPIEFRFVAEPFEDAAGHDHAVLSTGLGPAFVLSGSGGRSAAERAAEAQRRLNEAAAALKASRDTDVRARGLDGTPVLMLIGKDTPLLEVTLDDAAGYEENWTGPKGGGGEVTPARLATWWEAVARDLVLILARGEKPHFAADAAPEGRVFADLHAAARRSAATGVPRQMVAEARPSLREALRAAGLRVPASVKVKAAGAASSGPGAPAEPAGPPLRLEGRWSGTETESGSLKYITANFAGAASTFTYERALSLTVPMLNVQQLKGAVRFSVQTGTGPRHYQGRWDGQKLSGTISVDPAGRTPLGAFELAPR